MVLNIKYKYTKLVGHFESLFDILFGSSLHIHVPYNNNFKFCRFFVPLGGFPNFVMQIFESQQTDEENLHFIFVYLFPRYIYLGASIPALLLTILLFMDQQITSVIVNRKEHKLKVNYHL